MDPLKRPTHRLPRWQRRTLTLSGALLLATGIAWLPVHYGFGAGAGELPHPVEAWMLRLHGAAAFVALFCAGVLAAAHIPQGWRLSGHRRWRTQRWTGLWLCALTALLAVSGWLLYYCAPETVRPMLGGVHAALGVSMAGLLLGHRRGAG